VEFVYKKTENPNCHERNSMKIENLEKQLDTIHDKDSLNDFHRWFWNWWYPKSKSIAAELNAQLMFRDKQVIQSDVGYLCVGKPTDIVLLSMNPGYHQDKNKLEMKAKKDFVSYLNFVENYFEEYPKVVKHKGRFWSNAIGFAARVGGLQSDPKGNNWDYAAGKSNHPGWRSIAGWELFPFHSENDGFSNHLSKALMYPYPSNSPEDLVLRLAKASVYALFRTAPKEIIVASQQGVALVYQALQSPKIREQLKLQTVDWGEPFLAATVEKESNKINPPRVPCSTVVLKHRSKKITIIHLIPRQLFSNFGSNGIDRSKIIQKLSSIKS
jgi:hypothetical protein